MPRLKSYKRIITSDYKAEDREMIEQLAGSVNDAFNDVYFILNGRVELTNNLYCTVRLVDVTVDANGIPTSRTTITLNNTQPVIGCAVLSAANQTNSAVYPTGAPFISFTQIDQALLINHITGLQANNRYTIRIVAFN
jgi:bacillopeptidase F (M6 metalloprotease family)